MAAERRADRRFLKTALDRRYLTRGQVEQLLAAVRERGLPAEELAVELHLLSERRVRRLQNHLLYRAMRRADKDYANLAARFRLLTPQQLQEGLREQRRRFEATRERTRLGSLLIELGLLTEEQDRDLRLRVVQPSEPVGRVEIVSDVGSELASELGGCELSSEEELFESDAVTEELPSESHLQAANAATRLVADSAPSQPVLPQPVATRGVTTHSDTTSARVSIPLDEPDPVMEQVVESTRYRALDEAITRVEAIRKVQHDLSSSGVFCAKDSAEMFERACRARACDRLTSAGDSNPASSRAAASSAAARAVIEQEEAEAAELLRELEADCAASSSPDAPGSERPTRSWKTAGLKALLGIDAA